MSQQHIVIVGGGAAGITVAARLRNAKPDLNVTIIEPAEKHFYQPLWTLVGGGIFAREDSARDEANLIPDGARWIKDYATGFAPEASQVHLKSGESVTYDALVVAPGIQVNWNQVKGLAETLGKNGVCSNYSYESVASTWDNIRNLKQGVALFTQPAGAVKCGGAPQKICYLAEDHFRKSGVRDKIDVIFTLAGPRIFAVDKYAKTLQEVVKRKHIDARYRHNLIEIRGESREAVFEHLDTKELVVVKYDMVHVTPPMSAPDFVAGSPLAAESGWTDVDQYTLQHKRFANVFGLGDAANLPTSKTGAAIRKQAPVVVENMLAHLAGQPLLGRYDGYTSCPVVTGYDSMVLAEFNYQNQAEETFPFNQAQERFSMMMLKKHGLPALYWHGMLKGRA